MSDISRKAANNIRILSAAMVEKAKSGHPGGAMGGAEFINILYSEFLRFDPDHLEWHNRDRFFLDPGHMSPMLYSQMALVGAFEIAELQQFRQWDSPTPGHPEKDFSRGIENTSGPLGQGHTFAIGAAITEKFLKARFGDWMQHNIYTFISDGGIQEEISQGAGRIAGHLGLDNLIMFYDSNDIQLSSPTSVVSSENTAAKYRAWNWNVIEIKGNDPDQIRKALKDAQTEKQRPTLIIGKTIMGEGARDADGNPFEGRHTTHGQPLSKAGASLEKTIENLGGDPSNPFQIFADVKAYYAECLDKKRAEVKKLRDAEQAWRKANAAQAAKWDRFFERKLPADLDFARIPVKENVATRTASGSTLGELAKKVENMIVASADLSDSDKTEGFLKNTKAFVKGDFSGAFLQAGVSELTMAALAAGMALHGGVVPACGTFFVFSDYIKPVLRTCALMELQVIFIWTHDAFRVGEDGPTHQPVEHEAQLRLMEHLQNHHHRNSVLVLRPADAHEAVVAWKMAMENRDTPTALVFSRQDIQSLPADSGRYQEALTAEKGAYVVVKEASPDVVLLASGSEVATLVAGAKLLSEDGIKARVVSVPSEGLFRVQNETYKTNVLPPGVKRFGLTAGLPVTLQGLVGENGKVWGLPSFGFSAPAGILDEKLGYTAANVRKEVKGLLGK
ncbi:transketolase [Candidatus Haliotispira prima]|uniref:Transketolase n=1 Tax=Candidatus Haliotispira prima TaxID=3034016 RepID=A0ABY8MFV9_9SPIO|nr:transketolase [Candidatus Haliotispira prima]